MNYTDCQYYKGITDRTGWCELNESSCLVEAFKDDCPEIKEQEEQGE